MNKVKKMKIAFVILSYRNIDDTVDCIKSISCINTPRKDYEIILVDNSEDDGESLAEIKKRTTVDYSLLVPNNGYSHGNNIGIKIAYDHGYDYICVINNDTIVTPNFLDELLDVIKQKNDVALVAPLIYTYHGQKIWSSGGHYNAFHANYIMTRNAIHGISKAEFVNGCCFLFHRDLIEAIGYMDEDYFMYNEDADWCYKINAVGLSNYVVPKSIINHKVSISSGTNSPFQLYYIYKNRLLFIKKNQKGYIKLYSYMINAIQIIIRMMQYSIKSPKCSKALWHALVDANSVLGRGRY
jgi:GT2 family glycosyltransferase